jgi:hypothetical protein
MKKIISYSLWGEKPMYWIGALRNIELLKKYYPGWICRFYIDKNSKKELIDTIKGDNVEVILVESKDSFHGMFWRFWAAEDERQYPYESFYFKNKENLKKFNKIQL